MSARPSQYRDEIRTCVRLGASWPDRLRLAAATLEFHAANLAGSAGPGAARALDRYRVRLGSQVTDLWLRRRSGDFFVLHEIFTSAAYRIPAEWLGPVQTVVDLGANVGLTTLFFAQFFPDARYVCVEPQPVNAALLRLNAGCLGPRAEVIEAAVTDRSGQATLHDSGPSYACHIASETGLLACPVVRCCTLDEIVTSCGLDWIDLLKIDIEGAERDVFRRAPACLGKVGVMIIELHGDYPLREFEKDVAPLGFTVIPPGSPHGNAMVIAVSPRVAGAAIEGRHPALCTVA